MIVSELTDDERLLRFLRRDPALHLYALGDLDPRERQHTRFFGVREGGELCAVALSYKHATVLALGDRLDALAEAVVTICADSPRRLYAHLSPGVREALAGRVQLSQPSAHERWILTAPEKLATVQPVVCELLAARHEDELVSFYDHAYPGHFFDPATLDSGQVIAVRDQHARLLAVAGVHVASQRLGVAALGNVAVHPRARCAGIGRRISAELTRRLSSFATTIGLNVESNNLAARSAYSAVGFSLAARYEELWIAA